MQNINKTVDFINSKTNNFNPKVAIILGSGLGYFVDKLDGIRIKYSDIPDFPTSSVEGHKGELLFCEIEAMPCVVMQGRFHYYEGISMYELSYPVRIFKKLGIETLFITNAAGSIRKDFDIGDIVLVTDHINFMGNNPLIGKNEEKNSERFPDMSDCYTKKLQLLAKKCAKKCKIDLKEGVYLATTGPNYETKAEIKAYSILGADVVGMSTVPEAIVANYLKINTVAFSSITNYATGISESKLSHKDVLEIGKKTSLKLISLITNMISELKK